MMWYKNFIKNLIFDLYMLFIGFFRLIICKAVSKEVYGIQKSLRGDVHTQHEKWSLAIFCRPTHPVLKTVSRGNQYLGLEIHTEQRRIASLNALLSCPQTRSVPRASAL